MRKFRDIGYQDIERALYAYVKDLNRSPLIYGVAEAAAVSHLLNILKDIPEYVTPREYEKHVFLILEDLARNYQGDSQDYGRGHGAILVISERLRCLFYAQRVRSVQIKKSARKFAVVANPVHRVLPKVFSQKPTNAVCQ